MCRARSGSVHRGLIRRVLCVAERPSRSPCRLVKRVCLFLSCLVRSTGSSGLIPNKGVDSFCVGRTVGCVRRGFRGSVSVRSVTEIYNVGQDCLNGVFGGSIKRSPRRFLVGCHVVGTARLLGLASLSVTSINSTIKCRGRLRFSHTFGGVCKITPER